jgi:hypothetical protein
MMKNLGYSKKKLPPKRDSIARPITPQGEMIPLDHVARAKVLDLIVPKCF